VDEQQRLAGAFVEVVQAVRAQLEEMGVEGVEITPGHFRF
jgi:hypothetical protein